MTVARTGGSVGQLRRVNPYPGLMIDADVWRDAHEYHRDVLRLHHLALHGWGIGLRIQDISRGRLEVNQGSLYPALQRLEHRGDIESDWQATENNRRARYYVITRRGRKALGEEVEKWNRFSETMSLILES